jgi:murein L,D-transpeptidase YafK
MGYSEFGAGVCYQLMRSRSLMRAILGSTVIAAAMALAGCNPGGTPTASSRHRQPLSERMLAELEAKNMEKESPILVRVFKEEAELEVWKGDKTGQFALLRTYPICRWSGQLGPKVQQGDRQTPEGFYTITPGLMNPNSNYYLAINTGFPNAYDRANGRTGAFLMIHGDCSSSGCYAMTDEQIAEIYALARESFFGGQKSFQIQAYPFRMTPLNLAKHRNSPHMAFWKMLKQGYDHFEVTHRQPKVDVCEKHYVFDAESTAQFSPTERCPAYRVPEDIAAAVRDKHRRDDIQTAELISRGTPAVPVTTGIDGGMNPIFFAAVKSHGPGVTIRTTSGTIPAHVNPPAELAQTTTAGFLSFASTESRPAPAPRSLMQADSTEGSGSIGSFSGSPFGSKSEEAARNETAIALVSPPPSAPPRRRPSTDPKSRTIGLLSGAAPTVPAGSFDNRYASWR